MKTIYFVFPIYLTLFSLAIAQEPNLTLTSSAFENDQFIPSDYTCSGTDINPPLAIKNIPVHTKSLLLVVHDPDAPRGNWTHWVVYGIKPDTKFIAENSIPGNELLNDFGNFHYSGPCPPDGKPHHYVFDLYALDTKFSTNEGARLKNLLIKIQGHILDKTQLIGVYRKFS